MRKLSVLCVLVLMVLAGLYLGRTQRQVRAQASSPALADASVASVLIRFGLTDTEPRAWDGSLAVEGGELLALRNWRPRPEDRITGPDSWKLDTTRGVNFRLRAWEEEPAHGPRPYLLIPGIVVDVRGSSATRIRVTTVNGSFTVEPFSLLPGQARSFLDGAVTAERVPTAELVSGPGYQNDYATLVAEPGGQLWVAWVAYNGWKNQVQVRHFDGKRWGQIETISGDHSDIFLVKAARDGNGAIWFVWSAQVNHNFDLYARSYRAGQWSTIQRLTEAPQPDIFPAVATDARGHLWVAWQGFRNGSSDIFVRKFDGSSWSPEERVSSSPANDWEPAIAADSKGRVYVAWDTYDKGNYDVVVRRYENGTWSDLPPLAETPKFEAHVSLACDKQDRLWVAWNESGTQWGKDTGFLLNRQGTRLYQSRWMAVAVLGNDGWREPVANLEESLPAELRGYNDLPTLQVDGHGRVWVLFRHRQPRVVDTPSSAPMHRAAWTIYATTYEGDHWSRPMEIPCSQGRTDMRIGATAGIDGDLVLAWPTDNRDFEEFLFQRAEVYVARLPRLPGAAGPAQLRPRVPEDIATFPLHPNESQDLERIRAYTIESGGRKYKIYRGDTHRHTEFSHDGNNDGSLIDTYRYALDAVNLDFLMVSDHNSLGGPDVEYVNWILQQMADVFRIDGRFTPLFGYERSVPYPNGHRNVIFAVRGRPTLPIPPEETKGKVGAAALYEYLKKYGGICISHTSATNMGTDWRDNDPEVEPLVEIYQGDRVSAEYEGAPKAAWGGKPSTAPGGFRPLGYVWNAWAKGYKLGVQASSDHLSTHISYACTLAEEFTREGLVQAMKRRHSYGATDNIILDYRLRTPDGKEYLQGDIVSAGRGYKLWVKVIGTAPIRQIDIIKNNRFVLTRHPLQQEVTLEYQDVDITPGESYYYVRVQQADDQMAWSSPIWVTVK